MNNQEWFNLCEEYDELTDQERKAMSFEEFLKIKGYVSTNPEGWKSV